MVAERMAKMEQRLDDHLDTCDLSREENKVAHDRIWVQLGYVSARLWYIMGLIVLGSVAVTWTIISAVRTHVGDIGNW